MKHLLIVSGLLVGIAIIGFLYRNAVEEPSTRPSGVACTMEAKICPDGTAVGRQGPSCDFSPCLYPNVEIEGMGVAFAVPDGYVSDEDEPSSIAAFSKVTDTNKHVLSVHRHLIPEGETATAVIEAIVSGDESSSLEAVSLFGKEFRVASVEQTDVAVTSYFLVREEDVLRFDIREQVSPLEAGEELDREQLPEHQALLGMLRTLQTAP